MLLGYAAAYGGACCTTHTRAHHSPCASADGLTYCRPCSAAHGTANHGTGFGRAMGTNRRPCSATQGAPYHGTLGATHALANHSASRRTSSTTQPRGPIIRVGGVSQCQQAAGSDGSAQGSCRKWECIHAITEPELAPPDVAAYAPTTPVLPGR